MSKKITKDVCCQRCDTKIGNDDGVNLSPVKIRMRYNYVQSTLNVQCHQCYFVNIFKFNSESSKFEVVSDCEKINNKYQLENQNKK